MNIDEVLSTAERKDVIRQRRLMKPPKVKVIRPASLRTEIIRRGGLLKDKTWPDIPWHFTNKTTGIPLDEMATILRDFLPQDPQDRNPDEYLYFLITSGGKTVAQIEEGGDEDAVW